jgi:hypothetical protein
MDGVFGRHPLSKEATMFENEDMPKAHGLNETGVGNSKNGTTSGIRDAQNIPLVAASSTLGDGYTADVSAGDINGDGFQKLDFPQNNEQGLPYLSPRLADLSGGDTYDGDPYDKGGFLNRPNGWER